jgi:hypothetical protein
MSLAFLPLLAAIAAAQTPQPGTPGAATEVKVVVAELAALQAGCSNGDFKPYDILIDVNPNMEEIKKKKAEEPYHCVEKGKLLKHGQAEGNSATLVMVDFSQKQSVRWVSAPATKQTPFAISAIRHHLDKNEKTAPANPFTKLTPSPEMGLSFESGPLDQYFADEKNPPHRYKLELKIGTRTIDPDVWCQP